MRRQGSCVGLGFETTVCLRLSDELTTGVPVLWCWGCSEKGVERANVLGPGFPEEVAPGGSPPCRGEEPPLSGGEDVAAHGCGMSRRLSFRVKQGRGPGWCSGRQGEVVPCWRACLLAGGVCPWHDQGEFYRRTRASLAGRAGWMGKKSTRHLEMGLHGGWHPFRWNPLGRRASLYLCSFLKLRVG